ncbi:MAG: YdeI/OmpD-associated family protein [Spirosomataceae bacterium]
MLNPKVDVFFEDGCGRCPLGGTPQCKVHDWHNELKLLRNIVLDCGLTEELKWGVPCYTFQKTNVILLGAFKESCTLSFLKGTLLQDEHGILSKPGENSQSARLIRFTHAKEIIEMKALLKAYIYESIEIERAGLKVDFKAKNELVYPKELQIELDKDPSLKAAFEALTPGRQRGYLLYIAAPKQAKTRAARIEKYRQKILDGRGFHD